MLTNIYKLYDTVQKRKSSRTNADDARHLARLTLHLAAPMESTVTVLFLDNFLSDVTSATAQDVATFLSLRGGVANPPLRTKRAQSSVGRAKFWRIFRVDQVFPTGRLDGLSFRDETVAVVPRYHFDGTIEAFLEMIPDIFKRRHFVPASLQRARTRKTMTFAFDSHVVFDRLQK